MTESNNVLFTILVNQDPFSIDKNQQNEYTELPTIAVIGLAGWLHAASFGL